MREMRNMSLKIISLLTLIWAGIVPCPSMAKNTLFDEQPTQPEQWLYYENENHAHLRNDWNVDNDAPMGTFFNCTKQSAMVALQSPITEEQRKFFAHQLASAKGIHTQITSGHVHGRCWGESATRHEWDEEINSTWSFTCTLNAKSEILDEFARTGEVSVAIGGTKHTTSNVLGRDAIKKFIWECKSNLQRETK